MGFPFRAALLGALTAASLGLAQGQGKKDVPRPHLAEVRLGDGSVVRMSILQENLEVNTRYGKLVIPVKDVRRIDFGLHLPVGMEERVTFFIQQLGSDIYKEREEAAKELVGLGVYAFPSLQRASRSPDLEVVQRALTVMKRISDTVPPD